MMNKKMKQIHKVTYTYIIFTEVKSIPSPIQNEPMNNSKSTPSDRELDLANDKTSNRSSKDKATSKNSKVNNDKDSLLSYINVDKQINQIDIDEAPIIKIEEESKNPIFEQKQIMINAGGLVGSTKEPKDGITIFGQRNTTASKSNNKINVDYYINSKEKFPYPYLFAIYYNIKAKKYYIQAYKGQGSDIKILFLKLNNNYSLSLKQKEIVSAGNLIFQISPIKDHCLEINNISLKHETNSKLIFDPKINKCVTIGRDKSCNFSYPDRKSFSKIHTTFIYDDIKEEWVIHDGTKTKSSTNGTWIFGIHSFEIKDQMIVEILTSKIKFLICKNKKDNDK
jgi:hypothetical protein